MDTQWAANGPNWVVALLRSADAVLALEPGFVDFDLGVVGPYPAGSPEAFEVRAFFPKDGRTAEDPVTGSLNGALAQWLVRTGRATLPYVASQGGALGRAGRVHLSADEDGAVWVAGATSDVRDRRGRALARPRRHSRGGRGQPPVAANQEPPPLVTNTIGAMHGFGRLRSASMSALPPPALAGPVVAGNVLPSGH